MTTENPQELPFEEKMLQELISMGINEHDGKRIISAVRYAEEKAVQSPWNDLLITKLAHVGVKILKVPNYREEGVAVIRDYLAQDGDFLKESFQALAEEFKLSPQHGRRTINTAFANMLGRLQGDVVPKSSSSRLRIETRGNRVSPNAGHPSRGGFKF